MVHKKEKVKLQCGYEDDCKIKSCLKCRRYVLLHNKRITLAEAIALEDFAMVDLDAWASHHWGRSQRNLSQDIMRKMLKRIVWEKKGRWLRKIQAFFRYR
jgi:formate dehydrogenase maturation protein FdhE